MILKPIHIGLCMLMSVITRLPLASQHLVRSATIQVNRIAQWTENWLTTSVA